ncbi:MAG: trypsin-like peptidase domain-containing protein [Anaerolineae bacterium]|nr:trypsin-like peptidase domain-containing protein [Anaerolineae bacterium]
MQTRNKSTLWLAGCVVIVVSLLAGAIMGGVAGYIAAKEQVSGQEVQPVLASTSPMILPEVTEQPVAVTTPAAVELQSLVVTEQSAIVDAVKQVLPAVVTVVNQGQQGIGSGTGFFISKDGYVVTNNHVVVGARELLVIFAQGGSASAQLVGTAPEFDLAVLKVEGAIPATIAAWGDSGELPLGSHVIAIGSALGRYQNTVTAGILSGFNRELGSLRGLLQTDAAINQGNSGGPLINLAGQVIGINTMVVRGGYSEAEGLGFAIPSNVAMKVVERLIETGEAHPSFLGINYEILNPQLANEEGLSITDGALLHEVIPDTPAAQAGLRPGDVIVAINGQMIDERHPLVSLLLQYVAGETITLDVLRDGQTFQTTLTLGERA